MPKAKPTATTEKQSETLSGAMQGLNATANELFQKSASFGDEDHEIDLLVENGTFSKTEIRPLTQEIQTLEREMEQIERNIRNLKQEYKESETKVRSFRPRIRELHNKSAEEIESTTAPSRTDAAIQTNTESYSIDKLSTSESGPN